MEKAKISAAQLFVLIVLFELSRLSADFSRTICRTGRLDRDFVRNSRGAGFVYDTPLFLPGESRRLSL